MRARGSGSVPAEKGRKWWKWSQGGRRVLRCQMGRASQREKRQAASSVLVGNRQIRLPRSSTSLCLEETFAALTIAAYRTRRSRSCRSRCRIIIKVEQIHLLGLLHRLLHLRRSFRRRLRLGRGTTCRSGCRATGLLIEIIGAFVLVILRPRLGPIVEPSRAGPEVWTHSSLPETR
jgi:hypothetical protein